MTLIGSGGSEVGGGGGGGSGGVVLVGVKLDTRSKELLTWALVKVAQSGDRVIALHVLDPNSGKSTLLSLVKTFDSVLDAYEGFCSLKQVDLKLKVCRGSPVHKVLVNEARSYGQAVKIIVGTSGAQHTIRSSLSVAKYCWRKLPRNFSVFAIENGRVVYEKGAENEDSNNSYVQKSFSSFTADVAAPKKQKNKSPKKKKNSSSLAAYSSEESCTQLSSITGDDKNSVALVPIRTQDLKSGWGFLRRMFSHNLKQSKKSSVKKISAMERVLKVPSRQCWAPVYPDQRSTIPPKEDHYFSIMNVDKGEDVSFATDTALLPFSPSYCPKSHAKEVEAFREKYSSSCRCFSYQELLLATSDFMPENIIGKGGSSKVYRGYLPDGEEVAVKTLKPSEDVSLQFVSEIRIITTLQNKNIISLIGFCVEENNLLLVYDYLSRGSLEENLHGGRNRIVLSCEDRFKVALGVAEALDYLHNGASEPIIHRDVKSSNILLTDDFEAKLSDFGFAIWASSSSYRMDCTDVAGTFGYLAPEYFMHGKMNEKIDVYAFGVVLLELLSGRKPIDNEHPKGQESLVMWANQILKDGEVAQLVDPVLGSEYDHDQLDKMVLAATLCIIRAPQFRPQISLILKLFQGDAEAINWARQQISSSSEELDTSDGEQSPSKIQSFLNLAMQDLKDDSLSISSTEQNVSIEAYLQGRWSRTSSFN